MTVDVKFWETVSGRSPVLEFIKLQPAKDKDKIMWYIEDKLARHGLALLHEGIVRKIARDLYELKIRVKHIFYRILFIIKKSTAWLLVIFKKKEDRTPKRHIDSALAMASQII